MTDPGLHAVMQAPPDPTLPRRRAPRVRAGLGTARTRLVAPARMLPGVAAAGCGFAGAWLLWGVGWALLTAALLLLAVDARTPRA